MARVSTRYVCQDCGTAYRKWQGRCDSCGEWNTIVEETPREVLPKGIDSSAGHRISLVTLDGVPVEADRRPTGIAEFDRVCGGGLVAGSAILVGGDPGIGKSTLLLQVVGKLAMSEPCAYFSGEEAVEQIRLRAARLWLNSAPVRLATATNVRDILTTLEGTDCPSLVVIDSIQTMYVDTLDSAPGTVAQVRASAHELIRLAKRQGTTLVLVGHVTKEGMIAGPRVLEHMVDTVLYFEGERGHQYRVLRAVKNRFGPTDEIGVFEMTDRGLLEVANPSALFLSEREVPVSGTAVFAGIEGTRPILVEIQALVAPTAFATPRRAVVGWDAGRLAMVLAVLEARCGLSFASRDVYLNVAGGMRISEPAADLAVATALISARLDVPVPAASVVFGEIGLGGEVRRVGHQAARLREATKLGFVGAIVPKSKKASRPGAKADISLTEVSQLRELVDLLRPD
jgi:DNA repair protein RadA/Sms